MFIGPEDYRDDPEHPHSKKCECIVEFSINQLQLHTNVVEVVNYHVDHTQEDGILAHRPNDPDSIRRKTTHRPWMSIGMKAWVKRKLSERFTSLQIFGEHRHNCT
jgi:hypothetical protein